MRFSEKLKVILNNYGVTQSELSKRTGINKAIISEYLSGKYEPKQKNLFKIATALNIKPSDLITDYSDIPASAPVSNDELTQYDKELVAAYKVASDDDKNIVDSALRKYINDDFLA